MPYSNLLRPLITIAGIAILCGCPVENPPATQPESPSQFALSGHTMGTTYSVKLADPPAGKTQEGLQVEIERILDAVDSDMSTYRDDSLLSRFNRHEGTDWFSISQDLARVVSESRRVSELSDGAFDVTVLPLVNLWHFGPTADAVEVPASEAIDRVRLQVGYRKLEVRLSPPALRKQRADLAVDLSAIAKGFAVDQVAELLEALGADAYLVEIGGETRTRGNKPDGSPWRIGIEAPEAHQRSLRKVVLLGDHAMATSGDYRNFFERDGQRYSHTIDPRTGRPITHRLASASVVADTCATADAMATAILVLGPDAGFQLAVDEGLAALLIIRDNGGFTERPTPRFRELFEP